MSPEIQHVLECKAALDAAKKALGEAVRAAFPIGSTFKFSHGYHKTAFNEPIKARMHYGVVVWHDPYGDGKTIGVRNVKTDAVHRINSVYEVQHHWDLENDL